MVATMPLLLLSTAALLPFMVLFAGKSGGELDLAPSALLRVTSIRSTDGNVNDRYEGPLALHDGDPFTSWYPAAGQQSWLTVRLQGVGADGIVPERLVLSFPGDPVMPERVEWAGQALPAESCSRDGNQVVCALPRRAGRWLRLTFPPMKEGDGVSALEIFARPTLPDAPSAPTVEPWMCGQRLTVVPVSGTIRIEAERRQPGKPPVRFLFPPGSKVWLDRPEPGRVEYAVRGIGFGGAPGPWSEATDHVVVHSDKLGNGRWSPRLCSGQALVAAPALPVFGVVEGFYGRPWTWDERLRIVRLMAALGMSHYVYAPKDDLLHRDDWRTPYPAAELARFAELLATCRSLSLTASFGISPGLSMDPDSDGDLAALFDKLEPLLDLGFESVTLCMDDIKASKNPRVGAAHARLATKLFEHLAARRVTLLFVGTVYAGTVASLQDEHRGYLEALRALPPEIPVMWTGDGVFDSVMEPRDAAGIARLLGRAPLVWDNFPVNDYAARSQRLFLGAVTGREPALFPELAGLLSNPMTHACASTFSLLSYGNLLAGKTAEPLPADLAVALGLGAEAGPLLASFARDHLGSEKMLPGRPDLPELSDLSQRFLDAVEREDDEARNELGRLLLDELARRYLDDLRLWQDAAPISLADDLAAPLLKRSAQLELGLEAVSLLASGSRHPWGPARFRELAASYGTAPLGWRWFGLEEALGPLFEEAQRTADRLFPEGANRAGGGDISTAGMPLAPRFPDVVEVSEPFLLPLVQRPASRLLPGDGVRPTDDAKLVAERPGFHRVVVVASDGPVVAATGFELFAREAAHESEGGKAASLAGGHR